MGTLEMLFYFVLGAALLVYWALKRRFSYWADRGVVHDKPILFYGNLRGLGRTVPLYKPFREFYLRYRGKAPYGGFYMFLRRAAVVLDLELAKNVLIKDFQYFSHRGQYYNERDDPLTGHIFNLDGPKWKSLRAKLTPTFSSGKMKFMFPTVVTVAQQFVSMLAEMHAEHVRNNADAEWNLEVKELLARFTTDVIGTCAFGLDCNCLKDPNAQFHAMGQKVFRVRRHGTLIFALAQAFPQLGRRLHVKLLPDEISDFFMGVVRDTVAFREQNDIRRNDFLDLLIELKHQDEKTGLTLEEIAAQAFVFFLAGFETSSSTMGFSLYELALHPDIQDKARAEVSETLARHQNQFTYEAMHECKYLRQILHESLRKYSIAPIVARKTVKDYQVPNSSLVIEKGIMVVIPIDAIHHDPDIYPDPERFDPDRFSPEQMEQRHPLAWLPFGEGPRNCIGLRFGEMQSIIGLALLLKNFRFSIGSRTQVPLEMDNRGFTISSRSTVLKVEHIPSA